MKWSFFRQNLALVMAVFLCSGCELLDALDTYHYVGIYEDSYNDEGLSASDQAKKFDEFLAAVASATGYGTETIMRDANIKMARLVIPKDSQSKLNRVVISENVFGKNTEVSISIIKVPPGEDAEVIELKKKFEKAFESVHLKKWKFYIQHTHGQIFNS